MKNLLNTIASAIALTIICYACSPSTPTPTPTPPTPTTYTVSYNVNGGSGSVSSQSATSGSSITIQSGAGLTNTGYTFNGWNTATNGSGTAYAAGASLTVTANVTLYAQWQVVIPTYTAVFTAVDASSSALLKALPGNSVAKALVLNVTTAGSIKLDVIGSLTNGNPAIGYYWITSRDSSEVFQSTSTLNPVVAKTAATASQTINLSVGVNVICFKTAPYSGGITNGLAIGLKVTGANSNTISSASFTADASYNVANLAKNFCKLMNGTTDLSGETTNDTWFGLQVNPFNDEAGTVYDGTLYPSISFLSLDIKSTSWFTGTFTNYSNLDFTNSAGSLKQDLTLIQDNNGVNSIIFKNSDAVFNNGILQFSKVGGVKLVKSFLGNYSYSTVFARVYNSGTTFGPASVCWIPKVIRYVGNPEIYVYDPSGNRIW